MTAAYAEKCRFSVSFPLIAIASTLRAPGTMHIRKLQCPFSLLDFFCSSLDELEVWKTNHVGISPRAEPQGCTCPALHRGLPF